MRQRWTFPEVRDLRVLTWEEFTVRHPSRTYDSWEVKRRRVPRAGAGRAFVLRFFGVTLVLRVVRG